MELMLAAVVLVAGALAVTVIVVLYRAISAILDWLILTFGNEESVRRLKEDREDPPLDQR